MTRFQRWLLAALSGVLLSVPFFDWGTGLLMMVAFVPLLFIEDDIASANKTNTVSITPTIRGLYPSCSSVLKNRSMGLSRSNRFAIGSTSRSVGCRPDRGPSGSLR